MTGKKMLHLAIVFGIMAVTGGYAFSESGTAVPVSDNVAKKQLLFFMNPNGRPCQMQDEIIRKMGVTLTDVATVKYIKTTNRDDYPTFRTYGIRGLPSLIILDENGREFKRFTPGVQSAETILSAVQLKK
ncbi:MAG: thioredoxin family protein [Chitinispirillaceae bacterium]|nr:thioredoxin family protein [Chitinispirillaceae bacterium]